jgi:hypothetical protein
MALSRATLGPESATRVQGLLDRPLSWPAILERADHEGVLPLVYRNLASLGFPGTPPEIREALQTAYRDNAARHSLLSHELARLLRLLDSVGIQVIPLKGVALGESLYGDGALRVSVDIDILVPRSAARRAVDAVRAVGYQPEFDEPFLLALLQRTNIELALTRRTRTLEYPLDLHWGLAWPGARERAALEELWDAAGPSTFDGALAWAMTREWELLFLALHAARHRWRLLKWLVDIDTLCARGGFDWTVVLDSARRFGWEGALRVSLAACETLFGTPLPSELRGGRVPEWAPLYPDAVPENAIQDVLMPLRLRERRREKLGHLARVLLVPTLAERRLVRLPRPARLLYYPLRPLRLAGKWGVRLLAGPRAAARADQTSRRQGHESGVAVRRLEERASSGSEGRL